MYTLQLGCVSFLRERIIIIKKKKERERISGQRQDIGKKKKLRVGVAFKTSMITPHLVKSC